MNHTTAGACRQFETLDIPAILARRAVTPKGRIRIKLKKPLYDFAKRRADSLGLTFSEYVEVLTYIRLDEKGRLPCQEAFPAKRP